MTHAGVQMFMEKLKQLINCKDNPLINNPSILYAGPQFQLLYEELGSMIQTTLFIDKHHHIHELEKVNDLKKRFNYAAEEAEDIVDLFLSSVHIRNLGHFTSFDILWRRFLNLDDVMKSIKSVKDEFMSTIMNSMNMDSSQRTERMLNQSAAAGISGTRNSLGPNKLLEEIVVGLDCDVEIIRDNLVEDEKKLDVVSIVGMGGIGKTTLATKVFND